MSGTAEPNRSDAAAEETAEDHASPQWLAGGGEMGARVRAFDWASTPLGPVDAWPQSLKTTVSICLSSRFPIFLWWGPAMVMLYNDAYVPIPGGKHPHILGQRGEEGWADVWDIIGPMLHSVRERGEATWSEDQMLPLNRKGYPEECFFTFSYSPVCGESSAVDGIFTAVTETTRKVVGERRLRTLRNLGERTSAAETPQEACASAAASLGEEGAADIPFALLYLRETVTGAAAAGSGERLVLAGVVGLEAGEAAAPQEVSSDTETGWPLFAVLASGIAEPVPDLPARFGPMPGGPWPEPAHQALVLPLAPPGTEQDRRPDGVLVTGISPRRPFDADYHSFLELVAGQIATAVTNARAYEEEKRRAEALAELDQAKTTFFGNVSHEFRTPLTLILGLVEEALAHPNKALSGEDLDAVYRNSLRLLKLVNTLLDFSRIEAGRAQARYEPTDLSALTAELASAFRSAIKRAGMQLTVECAPLPEPVYVDRDMWEKIVLNLLSNAVKFTQAGEIQVQVQAVPDGVQLSVRDTGVGVPASEIPHLFERFHRVQGVEGRTHEGTGIGLALVQELVKLHGGTVQVESDYGQGSTFTVAIPFGTAHLPTDRIGDTAPRSLNSTAVRAEAFVEEALRWLPDEENAPVSSTSPTPSATPQAPPARILLADDNADMRAYVSRLLSAGGYTVEAVADGVEALAAARARPPDLLLTDVMMPRLDGFGLVRALRADPRTRPLPIILLSARAGEESTVEGLETGADDYLIKPFSSRELMARVHAHLDIARVRREAEREQRRVAETLQRSLLLTPPANLFPGLTLARYYEAASDDAEVGGDFFDAYRLPDGCVALLVGDVTGKGLQAATFTAELKFALRAYLHEDSSPGTALARLNRFLMETLHWNGQSRDAMGVLALAVVDCQTGLADVSAAGAEPPLLLHANGLVEEIRAGGPLLGVELESHYTFARVTLEPGASLLLVTDGITESRRNNHFFGTDGLIEAASAAVRAGICPDEMVRYITDAARRFGGKFRDDVCLLLAQRE